MYFEAIRLGVYQKSLTKHIFMKRKSTNFDVYIIKTYKEAFSLATIICLVTKVKLEMLQNLKFYSKSLAMSWQRLTIQRCCGGVLQKKFSFLAVKLGLKTSGEFTLCSESSFKNWGYSAQKRKYWPTWAYFGGGTLGAQYFTIYKWLWVYIWALTQKLGVFLRTNIHRN